MSDLEIARLLLSSVRRGREFIAADRIFEAVAWLGVSRRDQGVYGARRHWALCGRAVALLEKEIRSWLRGKLPPGSWAGAGGLRL